MNFLFYYNHIKNIFRPTHVCSFGREHMKVFSASDDKTVRCWDLPTEKETFVVKAHKVSYQAAARLFKFINNIAILFFF